MANMTEARFASSKLYQEVLKACEEHLLNTGQFHKTQIMVQCKNEALTDSIRWDWIVNKIKAGHLMPGGKVELIPVAESFFKANAKAKAAMHIDETDPKYSGDSFPGKYIAHGYGKRTAGWVLAAFAEGRFAVYKAKLMKNNSVGRQRKLESFAGTVSKQLTDSGEAGRAKQITDVAAAPIVPQLEN